MPAAKNHPPHRFTVIPASVSFRPAPRRGRAPARRRRRPQGRKHLDGQIRPREGEIPLGPSGKGDDTSSCCWVRVRAGGGLRWGESARGRVVVDFINGDPDRPIITGRVQRCQHATVGAAQRRRRWAL